MLIVDKINEMLEETFNLNLESKYVLNKEKEEAKCKIVTNAAKILINKYENN